MFFQQTHLILPKTFGFFTSSEWWRLRQRENGRGEENEMKWAREGNIGIMRQLSDPFKCERKTWHKKISRFSFHHIERFLRVHFVLHILRVAIASMCVFEWAENIRVSLVCSFVSFTVIPRSESIIIVSINAIGVCRCCCRHSHRHCSAAFNIIYANGHIKYLHDVPELPFCGCYCVICYVLLMVCVCVPPLLLLLLLLLLPVLFASLFPSVYFSYNFIIATWFMATANRKI